MKKIITVLTLLIALAMAGTCLAGPNGSALNRAERSVDKLVDSLNTGNSIAYSEVAKGFSAELQQKVTSAGLATLQKQINENFGQLQEAKLVSFERFDQGDRAVYLGGFSKENVVRMVFVFDQDGKINDFAFEPLAVQQEGK